MITALFRDITQRIVAIHYRLFGTDRLSETSVTNDHYLLHNSPEEDSSHTDKFFSIKEALLIVPSVIPISKCVSWTNDVNTSDFVVRIDRSRVPHTHTHTHTHRLHRSCCGLPKTLRQNIALLSPISYFVRVLNTVLPIQGKNIR